MGTLFIAALCGVSLLSAAGERAGVGAGKPPLRAGGDGAAGREEPDPLIRRYLGTWMGEETREGRGTDKTAIIEHYLLIKWQEGQLRVRTVDYLPERRVWGRHSNWQGTIRIDQWNVTKQTFIPREDGTLSVGFSGTNGFGQANQHVWWAAGRLSWGEDADGEFLHLETTVGYSPSSRGNAWRPIEQVYRWVSKDVDPRIDRRQRR